MLLDSTYASVKTSQIACTLLTSKDTFLAVPIPAVGITIIQLLHVRTTCCNVFCTKMYVSMDSSVVLIYV